MTVAATVVVLGTRTRVLPAEALPSLRDADVVFAAPDLDEGSRTALGLPPVPDGLAELIGGKRIVIVCATQHEPLVAGLRASGARVFGPPPGAALLAAVEVMDRLRSPGGCPWDAEQTHATLRQYLMEETYELLEAIEEDDRPALREELGDVLLQVLFHARIAVEHPEPFTVDDVADGLVDKLVNRHPHVFAEAGDPTVHDAATQDERWEQLKQVEKRRESLVDGVAVGQPALALASKLTQRARRGRFPMDLLPDGDDVGATLFMIAALARLAGEDPEAQLRVTAKGFATDLRTAEASARAFGIDPTAMTEAEWRAHWPVRLPPVTTTGSADGRGRSNRT